MVELKSLVIKSKEAPKEGVTLSFDKGINKIEYKDKYLFNFLKLKDQSASSGDFFINEISFHPLNEDNKSLFVLAINSQVVCLLISVIVELSEKKEIVKRLQEELVTLRDMPLSNLEEKTAKISAILGIITKYNLGYVLIDSNNEINIEHKQIIDNEIDKYKDNITFIILNKKTIEDIVFEEESLDLESKDNETKEEVVEEKKDEIKIFSPYELPEDVMYFNIGGYEGEPDYLEKPKVVKKPKVKKEKKIKEEKPQKENKTSPNIWKEKLLGYALPILKDNSVSFLLFILEATFCVGLSIIGPYLLGSEGATFGSVIMIILIIFCLFSTMFIASSIVGSSIGKKDEDNKYKLVVVLIYNSISALLGILFGYLVYLIFKSTEFLIKADKWADSYLVTSLFISILVFLIAILSKYIYQLIKLIKSKLNRD